MKTATLAEAREHLPELVAGARGQVVGLTDDAGNLVGLLSGVGEDEVDDLLAETPGFQAMIERSRASLAGGRAVPAEDLLAEARAEMARHGLRGEERGVPDDEVRGEGRREAA